ncbi:HpcH/HpaI aldolase/citrate lyase family protein [Pararhodobacter sp. CCB-MM2]|uniref:HpcH/HpaI aldolase family protein n=1 Tax=Pararhodobacter sp. CCB-MM2 TaxID=1786003 RepID=UPI00082A052A|nr:aldolase/citrate lyase family protein [Pararhodobacter sp. CCB-MM2]
MDLPKNTFKQALADMRMQRGLWCQLTDPLAAEMLAGAGYDWMLFDTEHSPLESASVLPLLQAAAPFPVSCIVRPTSLNVAQIKKILDLGAETILVPMVQDAEEAALAVAAVRYPPHGIRGVAGATRSAGFGRIKGYHASAHEETCLLVQLETAQALTQIEAVAAVEGVDGIFIGPADLAASMGHPGNPGHPEVKAAILDGIRRIRAAGKAPGILAVDPSLYEAAIEAGAGFVSKTIDLLALRDAVARGLA